MVDDKLGKKPYLGIEIDYDKENTFDKFSLDTLKDRYFWEKETHAQEAFARASVYGATYKGDTDFELAQRLYNYASSRWFMFSTVDIGAILGATVFQLLMALVLLEAFLSSTL
jgi:ribonucleotide reductase alpha subunit